MPAVTSGKVLVTGANGYIAVWILKSLLEAGYSVRGTVRSESKAGHLRELFKSYGDKLEVVIVADITSADAFTEHVKGVDAIAHTASPFHMKSVEPAEMITPAVEGTLSVLKAAAAHGPAVRRIIVLSSTAAVMNTAPLGATLDEVSWNDAMIAEVREKGRDASAPVKYCASKTLAERAAWEWWGERKGQLGWDLVALNPPWVYGPFLHDVPRPEELNESAGMWYNAVVKGADDAALVSPMGSYVDVRDIAQAHTIAFQKEEAGGNRFIITIGQYTWQDFVNFAHQYSSKLSAGNASYDASTVKHPLCLNNAKSISVLGMKYRTTQETTIDTLKDFESKGWL